MTDLDKKIKELEEQLKELKHQKAVAELGEEKDYKAFLDKKIFDVNDYNNPWKLKIWDHSKEIMKIFETFTDLFNYLENKMKKGWKFSVYFIDRNNEEFFHETQNLSLQDVRLEFLKIFMNGMNAYEMGRSEIVICNTREEIQYEVIIETPFLRNYEYSLDRLYGFSENNVADKDIREDIFSKAANWKLIDEIKNSMKG